MMLVIVPLVMLLWSPVAPQEAATPDEVLQSQEPAAIGQDSATKCKRKCNSQCQGANNKSKCVNECRRACDR